MRLSTLTLTESIYLVAERFIRADESVEIVMTLNHTSGQVIKAQGIVCQLGKSSVPKEIDYFITIKTNTLKIVDNLNIALANEPVFENINLKGEDMLAFILGGVFDSF